MTTLTVLSYNVRSLRDDTAALTRTIRAIAPDVVLVQESPRFARWRSACASLARRSGLVVVTGGRPAGSNLILSTLGVRVVQTTDLAFSVQRNLHRRGAAMAVLELSGHRFVVAGTHLDLIEAPRLLHVRELITAAQIAAAENASRAESAQGAAEGDLPLIFGGDLNAVPGSATWQLLAQSGIDAFDAAGTGDGFTYSAAAPVRRIDAVFASPALRPVRAEVLDSADIRRASDHRPLVVQYEF